jgi:hypothetical protein
VALMDVVSVMLAGVLQQLARLDTRAVEGMDLRWDRRTGHSGTFRTRSAQNNSVNTCKQASRGSGGTAASCGIAMPHRLRYASGASHHHPAFCRLPFPPLLVTYSGILL